MVKVQSILNNYHHFTTLFIIIFMVIVILFFGTIPYASALVENKPQTEAVSAVVFDAKRGQIIFSKTSPELSHSSLANRLMGVLIALEKTDLEALITSSKDAVSVKGAKLNLSVGEKYTVKSLLNALMLTGAKDAAVAIAEYVAGSQDAFVKLMNERALALGMKNTKFVNSTGDFHEEQVTTVDDVKILIKYALENSSFNHIFGTQARPWYDDKKTFVLTNTNGMFWNYNNTDGGTTTGEENELRSIVTTVTRNNMRLVCVLLDTPENSIYNDSISLLNYGFDNYLYGRLVSAGSSQQSVTIEGQALNLVPKQDVNYIYPKGQNFIKNIAINVDESKLKPPITKNTVIGMLTYTLSDDTIINVDLYSDREILPQKTKQQLLRERFVENKELIYVIIVLIVLEIIMGFAKFINFIRRQRIKNQARRLRSH